MIVIVICDCGLWKNGRIIKQLFMVNLSKQLFMVSLSKNKLDGLNVDELGTSTGRWSRYLVMTSMGGRKILSKLSPFAIHKGVKGISGGGDIYLTCSKKSQSDNLLKCVLLVWLHLLLLLLISH